MNKLTDDTILRINNQDYSLKKILGGEIKYKEYLKTSDRVQRLVRIKVMLDLSQIDKSFTNIDKILNKNP